MKQAMTILAAAAMMLAVSGTAVAATVTLSGTLSGTDSNTVRDDGDGNHGYDMDRFGVKTFYWSSGSTVSITGTVDVRGLASGSYLEVGLVDKEQADMSLDTPGWWGGYMFNNSAFATFYAGTRNYARLSDSNDLYSAQVYNPAGNTAGVFSFTLDIRSDKTMDLTLHGGTDASISYTYGTRNWWDGWAGWSGGELEHGSYLISQVWFDTGSTTNSVSATYDVAGASVPEPATMSLMALGGLAALGRRKRS